MADDTLGTLGNVAQIGAQAYGTLSQRNPYSTTAPSINFGQLPSYQLSDFQGYNTAPQSAQAIRSINADTAATQGAAGRTASAMGMGRSTAALQAQTNIANAGAQTKANTINQINQQSYNDQLQQMMQQKGLDMQQAGLLNNQYLGAQQDYLAREAQLKASASAIPLIGTIASAFY